MIIAPKRRYRIPCLVLALILLPVCAALGGFLLLIGPFPPAGLAQVTPQPLPADFEKGITYESWLTGEFASENSDHTLSDIIQPLGANSIALIVKCAQAELISTQIDCHTSMSATDEELEHVIGKAHDLGLSVMLKPHVNLADPNHSRDQISFGRDEAGWRAWFGSYTAMLLHYAELAQRAKVEYLVLGTELQGTSGREADWRALIHKVREVYTGKLTYAALTYLEPWQINWWDELDAIGIDAYYLITLTDNPTPEQLRLGWQPISWMLDKLAARWNKPILFTEVGYLSVDGSNRLPGVWQLDGATDVEEQAQGYQAIFDVFSGKSWWKGAYWWSYDTNPNQGGPDDRSYTPHGKPAEDVLRRWYGG
jgi:hypothetical protein